MKQSGWNPIRRNRNIGTSKQGHGKDNTLSIPQPADTQKEFYERFDDVEVRQIVVHGKEIPIIVEKLSNGFFYSCTSSDVEYLLNKLPEKDLEEFGLIIFRQPKKKELILSSVWGSYKLGCYYAGQFNIVPVDKDKALQLKLKAAKAGYSRAQFDVANTYAHRQEFKEAKIWLERAANQGHFISILALAFLYKSGQFIQKNNILAYFYFKIAVQKSNQRLVPKIQKHIDDLRDSMLPKEIEKAENSFNTWKPAPTPLTLEVYAGLDSAKKLVSEP